MAKKIIILEREPQQRLQFRYVLWADVPLAKRPFFAQKQANMVSEYVAATSVEVDALRTGQVTERVGVYVDRSPNPTAVIADVQAALISEWNAFQTEINATNVYQRYGTSWDGTSWTVGGS